MLHWTSYVLFTVNTKTTNFIDEQMKTQISKMIGDAIKKVFFKVSGTNTDRLDTL